MICIFAIAACYGCQDSYRQEPGDIVRFHSRDAIDKDPAFAPAYAGLAEAYAYRASIGDAEPDDVLRMRSAAEHAIQLDPLLDEAHDALGVVYARDGRWSQSEASFRRAIELNPNSELTRLNYVIFLLRPLGRIDEAIQQLRAAEKADPLSPSLHFVYGDVLIVGRPLRGGGEALPEIVGLC